MVLEAGSSEGSRGAYAVGPGFLVCIWTRFRFRVHFKVQGLAGQTTTAYEASGVVQVCFRVTDLFGDL